MIKIGEFNKLKVIRKNTYGLYLKVDDNGSFEEILLPTEEISEKTKIGDEITVFIYHNLNKQLAATRKVPYAKINEIARLKVLSNTNFGTFLDWGLDKNLFLPFKEQESEMIEGNYYFVKLFLVKIFQVLFLILFLDPLLYLLQNVIDWIICVQPSKL